MTKTLRMRPALGGLAMLCLALTATAAAAGTQPLPAGAGAAPDEVLRCLQRPAAGPAYPEDDKLLKNGGFVRVRLLFSDAQAGPRVEVLARAASDQIVAAVEAHLGDYRLPCLAAGQQQALEQAFHFTPQGEVEGMQRSSATPLDEPGGVIERCLRTPDSGAWVMPDDDAVGSARALRRKPMAVGNLIARLRFSAIDAAPEVHIVYNSLSRRVADSFSDYLREYRLSCMPTGASEVWQQQHFGFRPEGVDPIVLKDMGLLQLLGAVKDIAKQGIQMDLRGMACPFQLRWRLGMPVLPNEVVEVGKPDPSRSELIRWLGGVTLDLKPAVFEQVLGQPVIIDVPCVNLAIKPGN